jgi:hypothetical protein
VQGLAKINNISDGGLRLTVLGNFARNSAVTSTWPRMLFLRAWWPGATVATAE